MSQAQLFPSILSIEPFAVADGLGYRLKAHSPSTVQQIKALQQSLSSTVNKNLNAVEIDGRDVGIYLSPSDTLPYIPVFHVLREMLKPQLPYSAIGTLLHAASPQIFRLQCQVLSQSSRLLLQNLGRQIEQIEGVIQVSARFSPIKGSSIHIMGKGKWQEQGERLTEALASQARIALVMW